MCSADCGVRLKQGGGKKSFGRSLREACCPNPHGSSTEIGLLCCPYQLVLCLCLCAPFATDRERVWDGGISSGSSFLFATQKAFFFLLAGLQ